MKNIKLMLTMILSLALFGGMGSVNAATGSITTSTDNHAATISRTITGTSNKVTNTFTYTVTADSSNPTGTSNIPNSATVAFSNVTPQSGTATATGTLDFAGATFTKNGDYTYTITETSSTTPGLYPVDSTNTYTLKLSVRNATATDFTNPKVVTMYWYEGEATAASKLDPAQLDFTSAANVKTITIGKTVEGTMADPDEYFAVSITVNGNDGESYSITGTHKSGDPTSIPSGTATTVNLKHGDTITISGVPDGKTYSFTETGGASYQTYINGSTTNSKSSGSKTVGTSNSNTIKNVWNQPVITGVMTRILPYILIAAIGAAITVFVIARRMNNEKSEIIEE